MQVTKKIITSLSLSGFIFAATAATAAPQWSTVCDPTSATKAVPGKPTSNKLRVVNSSIQASFWIPVYSTCTQENVCQVAIKVTAPSDVFSFAPNNNARTTSFTGILPPPPASNMTIYMFTSYQQSFMPAQCISYFTSNNQDIGKEITLNVSMMSNTGKSQGQIGGNWH